MEKEQPKLMIPGPVQPEDEVLNVLGQPVQAHYGPEWCDFYNQTVDYMKKVFCTKSDVFLMVGSGSAGIDSCIGSSFSTGDTIIVGINGFFGERIKSICESYGLKVIPVKSTWGAPLNPKDFILSLKANPAAQGIAVVHLETSTTIINPIAKIGEIAKSYGVLFMVDAVSSLGGLPFNMEEWHIDLCASASQKCLGAPPGLSPVAVSASGWQTIDRKSNRDHGWYLNLKIWRQYAKEWADWHPFPITMATSNVAALNTSLKILMKEGLDRRIKRFHKLALRLRDGLSRIGMTPYTPEKLMAPVLTAVYSPERIPSSRVVDYLLESHSIKIAGGLGILKDRVFRIGHMSPNISEMDIDEVLSALKDFKSMI